MLHKTHLIVHSVLNQAQTARMGEGGPGSLGLAPATQKSQGRLHRKWVLSSHRGLMSTVPFLGTSFSTEKTSYCEFETLICYQIGWTHASVLAPTNTPCLGQGSSFFHNICTANNETDAKTGRTQALFNGQGWNRNLVHKSTSQLALGGDTIYTGELR